MDIIKDLTETWEMNNNVTGYLLDNIETEWLSATLGGKGRSIGEQFVHVNNIRSFWINKVGKKMDLKVDKKYALDKHELSKALGKSSSKMKETLTIIFSEERIKGYKPHPSAFFTQMIAHESHHRGQIMATITRNGFEINKSVNYGLWSWNKK